MPNTLTTTTAERHAIEGALSICPPLRDATAFTETDPLSHKALVSSQLLLIIWFDHDHRKPHKPLPFPGNSMTRLTSAQYETLLQRRIRRVKLDTAENDWYDLWHIHLDINWGEGNKSRTKRRIGISAHMALFSKIMKQIVHLSRPWQSWVMIDTKDSFQDAVFLHTPNPNHDNFPLDFSFVAWGIPTPGLLKGLIDEQRHEIGRVKHKRYPIYCIRMRVHNP